MSHRIIVVASFAALALITPTIAIAHPMAPSVLTFRPTDDDQIVMIWRSPSARPVGQDLKPSTPSGCAVVAAGKPRLDADTSSVITKSTLQCDNPSLAGSTVRVEGLQDSKANVVVRVELPDGKVVQALLSRDTPSVEIPVVEYSSSSFLQYLELGVEHLATGWDHILFVLGLMVLLGFSRELVIAVTSFTIGHSITLALATLSLVRVPVSLVESLIAASLIAVALEILSSEPGPFTRRPGALPLLFGLLHGLGFARVLVDAAIPQGEIPMALLGFNVGIELGQLALIAVVGIAFLIIRPIARFDWSQAKPVPAYVIGSLGAFWVLERAAQALGWM